MFSEFGSWPTLSCKTEDSIGLDGLVLFALVSGIELGQPIEVADKVDGLSSILIFNEGIWLIPRELVIG
jgi:hypothetical protein